MEREEYSLTLNYNRPIGQRIKTQINTAYAVQDRPITGNRTNSILTGKIIIYPELCVPSASDDNGVNLTSLANVIYEDARLHNMSLSAYGHLDPSKFAIAAGYVALMLQEVKRDLSVHGMYEFGNRTMGDLICVSFTGYTNAQLDDKLVNLCIKYNRLVRRLNNLYIPAIEIFGKWMPHRCELYRDDEGARYQLYAYKMSNYYKLDVLASSPTLGQLIFEDLPLSRSGGVIENVSDRLDRIDALLAEYEADDDMVNFATEAQKAGLSRLTLPVINVTESSSKDGSGKKIVELPSITPKFNVDDVFSVENAYFVMPFISRQSNGSALPFNATGLSWDILENITTGKFEIGKMQTTVNVLPILHPLACLSASISDCNGHGDSISRRPIFTHSEINSIEGLMYLTKYMASVGEVAITTAAAISSTTYPSQIGLVCGGDVTTTRNNATMTSETKPQVSALSTHGISLLQPPVVMSVLEDGSISRETGKNILAGCYCSSVELLWILYRGFKGVPYTYVSDPANGRLTPAWHDYDYITYVSADHLGVFKSAEAWNGFIMVQDIVKPFTGKHGKDKPKQSK